MIKVRFLREDKEELMEYKEDLKIEDILRKFGYSSETVVVKRNGKINTEDENVENDDDILIISVGSG